MARSTVPAKSGIYKIANALNGKMYIGSSKNMRRRKNEHFTALRLGTHCNPYLQRAFNKYGEENFEFSVVEECEEQFLLEREDFYILSCQSFSKINGYNVTSRAIRVYSNTGKKRSKEEVRRLANYIRESGCNAGENAGQAKLTAKNVNEIRNLHAFGYSPSVIADFYGISSSQIFRIINGERWSSLPFAYIRIEDIPPVSQYSGPKTRIVFGENHLSSKLSNEVVAEIRCKMASGTRVTDIAKEYNLHANYVSKIRIGKARPEAGGPILTPRK